MYVCTIIALPSSSSSFPHPLYRASLLHPPREFAQLLARLSAMSRIRLPYHPDGPIAIPRLWPGLDLSIALVWRLGVATLDDPK